jgi:hypothetical protein
VETLTVSEESVIAVDLVLGMHIVDFSYLFCTICWVYSMVCAC